MARQQRKVADGSPYRDCAPPIHRSSDKRRKLVRRRRSREKRARRERLQGSLEWGNRYAAYATREADDAHFALGYLIDEGQASEAQKDRLKRKQIALVAQVSALDPL